MEYCEVPAKLSYNMLVVIKVGIHWRGLHLAHQLAAGIESIIYNNIFAHSARSVMQHIRLVGYFYTRQLARPSWRLQMQLLIYEIAKHSLRGATISLNNKLH